jgi:lactate permease
VPLVLETALAALPIVAVLVGMLALRWSAARAAGVGLALALPLAWLAFGYGTRRLPELGPLTAMGGAMLEAAIIAATILWIILPALCIHELQQRTGALEVLRGAMERLSGDPRIAALLVAWFFVLFIEGAAGFGTSVALAAPFLVAAGFGRVEAVTIALVGHSVGVSFGAVGTPILPQLAVTAFSGRELAGATAA